MADPIQVWLVDNGAYWKAVWNGTEGRRCSQSIGRKDKYSRRQARVLCLQLGAELGRTVGRETAPHLFAWLDRYLTVRTDVKETTRRTWRECFAYLRVYFDNDPCIDTISRADAADWFAAVTSGELTADLNRRKAEDRARTGRKAGRNWRKPTLSTARRHVRAAKMVFQEAARQDRILFNPFDRLNGSPPKPLKKWREVTPAETALILAACPNHGWRALFALCRFAALRLGEARSLEWSHVDWDANKIRVNQQIEQETTKQAMRTCPIEPARCPTGLAAILADALDAAPDGERFVCAGVDSNNVRRTALNILKRAGIGTYPKPFHTLRKNRVSELAMQYPQGVVQDWCGHDEEVSRLHYQRVPEELYAPPARANVQNGHDELPEPRTSRAPAAPDRRHKSCSNKR